MASAKKGKKAKGKKTSSLSLQDFLQTSVPPGMAAVPAKVMNWADECEDDDFSGPRPLMALPTAPRAARILNDDTIPMQPPFNAFLSNLPFEIREDDLREFFDSLDIATKSIRVPGSSDLGGGRQSRGIGYVEYSTREDMIEAISLPDPMLRNRRIRIDVSNPNEQKDRGSDRNRRYANNEDRPERPIDTNWRQRAEKSPDRNGGPEPPRENRRYGGGGFGRERMRETSPRPDDGSSWRSERKPDPSPPRRREFDRDDRNRNRRGYEEPRGGFSRNDRQEEPARERPKLTLAPRTLPIEEPPRPPPEVEREKVESADEEPERPKPTPVPAAKVFGEAKPVDTLAKEQEIEARRLEKLRLAREKEQEEREAREREQEAARQLEREHREKELAEREKHVEETQEKEERGNASDESHEPPKKKEEVNWRKMCEDREKNKDQQPDDSSNGRRALSPRHSKRYSPDRRDMAPKRSMNVERRGGGGGGGGVYRDSGRPRDDRPRDGGRHRDADMERRNQYNDGQRRGSDRSRDNQEIKRKDAPVKKDFIERDVTLDDLPKLQQSTGPNFSVSNAFAELIDETEEEASALETLREEKVGELRPTSPLSFQSTPIF